MKTSIKLIGIGLFVCLIQVKAQWVVTDPKGLIQGILNSSKQISEMSKVTGNTKLAFDETVKIFNQGKAYYDALKSVDNLVKEAKKVQQTVLMVGEVSEIYVVNFNKMLSDENFSNEEINAIAEGYTILLQESTDVLDELKMIITPTSLSMTDKERIDIINRCHKSILDNRNLMVYYTNKNIGISYLRAKKKGEVDRIMQLYGNPNEKYW